MNSTRLFLLLAAGAFASAAPVACPVGSLQDYINLGAEGCIVEHKLFQGFVQLAPTAGANAIDPALVLVQPIPTLYAPGFVFTLGLDAGPGEYLQLRFAYAVTSPAINIIGAQLAMQGSAVTPDGANTALGIYCAGAAFDAAENCWAASDLRILFDVGSDALTADSLSFSPRVSVLGVLHEIAVDGGPDGRAHLDNFVSRVAEVPEPATSVLIFAGWAALHLARRLRGRS